MFDVTLILLIGEGIRPQSLQVWLVLLNFIFLFLLTKSRFVGCFLIILQKVSIITPVALEYFDTNFIIKNLAWMGFFSTYLFQLCIELNEAYFNPNYSTYDMSLRNYHVSGYLHDIDSSFVVTNLTRNGFFGFSSSAALNRLQIVEGCIKVLGNEYPFSGKIIDQTNSGFGVKVVIASNWDRVYLKIRNLKFLG